MDFKNTLNLPKTDFPMKADLPAKEQGYLAVWDREDLYEKMKTASEGRPLFVLHDGPPYANGHLHMGHAMNKILKDIINRVSLKKGRAISYVPGWDCHGLPIEHKVLKDMGKKRSDLSALEIRKKCRESATLYSDIQKKEFIRMGILGDFQNPYLTMDYSYEAEILRALGRMNDQGRIYKGEKPVLWCGTCETALADAEVEYAPHRSQSVTVLFEGEATGRKTYYPIWTTTPWTLPANQAVAVNPEVRYSLFELTHDTLNLEKGAVLVLAEAIADRLAQEGNSPWKEVLKASRRIGTRTGADLLKEKPSLRHPFIPGKIVPLVAGSFVQTDQGTGLVHIAPGHGEEDFEVGRTEGLSSETPVNGKGRYERLYRLYRSVMGRAQDPGSRPPGDHPPGKDASPSPPGDPGTFLSPLLAVQKPGLLPGHLPMVSLSGGERAPGTDPRVHRRGPVDSGKGRKPDSGHDRNASGLVPLPPTFLGRPHPGLFLQPVREEHTRQRFHQHDRRPDRTGGCGFLVRPGGQGVAPAKPRVSRLQEQGSHARRGYSRCLVRFGNQP
ncbi:MAG: hypothetical protein D084_Lepto4C00151G0002 [Leptospirillum sp. Group IV 'UBA BS']|nr:MAG: hypothetical protein D084_Lepto4C00151G0002 [Leptospirillum sp. Group IV 'UBA BS']